jgi:hypothetical protein
MLLKALRESDAFSFEDRRLSFVFVRFFFGVKHAAKEEKLDVALLRNASPAKRKRRKEISRSAERDKGTALDPQTFEKV